MSRGSTAACAVRGRPRRSPGLKRFVSWTGRCIARTKDDVVFVPPASSRSRNEAAISLARNRDPANTSNLERACCNLRCQSWGRGTGRAGVRARGEAAGARVARISIRRMLTLGPLIEPSETCRARNRGLLAARTGRSRGSAGITRVRTCLGGVRVVPRHGRGVALGHLVASQRRTRHDLDPTRRSECRHDHRHRADQQR